MSEIFAIKNFATNMMLGKITVQNNNFSLTDSL